MTISGPTAPLSHLGPTAPQAPGVTRASGAAAPPPSVPAELTLRDLLTDEERAFFDQLAQMGPLTYGARRGTAPTPTAPLGQRIDVRA
ncbi:MAG: hypothetical protein ACOY71_02130 [Gemmatimonadota bacterium]